MFVEDGWDRRKGREVREGRERREGTVCGVFAGRGRGVFSVEVRGRCWAGLCIINADKAIWVFSRNAYGDRPAKTVSVRGERGG